MSDDSTNPPEPATPEGDVPDAVVPPPPVFDDATADAVIPPPPVFDGPKADAVIPPPPAFDGPLTGAVPPVDSARAADAVVPPPPVFEGSTGDAVVPPPPVFDGAVTGASAPASDGLRRRAAQVPPVAPASDEALTAPALDPAFAAPPEVPASGSYRGWTVAIFSLLVLLLAGAIALVIYLATSTTLDWSTFDDASAPQTSEPSTSETTGSAEASGTAVDVADSRDLTAEPCTDFCAEIAGQVGASVIGADGAAVWGLATPWTAADSGSLSADEAAGAAYDSDSGRLDFTVWRFADDADAQRGFETLADELGEPTSSDAVYDSGRGTQNTYRDGGSMTILWIVADDEGQPWVMQLQGPDDDSVRQFYLALPF